MRSLSRYLALGVLLAAMAWGGGCAVSAESGQLKGLAASTATASTSTALISDLEPTPQAENTEHLGTLAFVRDGDIWVKDLPDGAEQKLTHDGRNSGPSWSPSGRWLAYRKAERLWLIDRMGSAASAVADEPVSVFTWSPNEDTLAYVSDGALHVVEADGSTRRTLITLGGRNESRFAGLAWSPDGKWLAYGADEIYRLGSQAAPPDRYASVARVRADAPGPGQQKEVLSGGRPSPGGFVVAGWSPDGSRILYWDQPLWSASGLADGTTLSAVPADGGQPSQLAKGLLYADFLDSSSPANALAMTTGTFRESWTRKGISVVHPSDGTTEPLTEPSTAATMPSWSPDGERIAYVAMDDIGQVGGGDTAREGMAQRRIWVMNRDGSGKRQLTDEESFRDERPRWSADGSSILFGRLKDDHLDLWLMSADGSQPRQVVERIGSPPDPSRQAETWWGYYGHIDWDKEYDWWQSKGAPAAGTPTPVGESTPVASPPVLTQALEEGDLRVTLWYPSDWQPVAGHKHRYGGEAGFVQVDAFNGQGWTLEAACQQQTGHKLRPFGANPTVERLQVDGHDACLILPSADQDPSLREQAAVVVGYPQPAMIQGATYYHLVLVADKAHIRQIAERLRFADSPTQASDLPAPVVDLFAQLTPEEALGGGRYWRLSGLEVACKSASGVTQGHGAVLICQWGKGANTMFDGRAIVWREGSKWRSQPYPAEGVRGVGYFERAYRRGDDLVVVISVAKSQTYLSHQVQLLRLMDSQWQPVWLPGENEWAPGHTEVDVADDLERFTVHTDSYMVAESEPNWSSNAGLHLSFVEEWQRRPDNYVRISRREVPSAYGAVVHFLAALAGGDDLKALGWASGPADVAQARALGLHTPPPDGLRMTANLPDKLSDKQGEATFSLEMGVAVRTVKVGEQWVVRGVERIRQ